MSVFIRSWFYKRWYIPFSELHVKVLLIILGHTMAFDRSYIYNKNVTIQPFAGYRKRLIFFSIGQV